MKPGGDRQSASLITESRLAESYLTHRLIFERDNLVSIEGTGNKELGTGNGSPKGEQGAHRHFSTRRSHCAIASVLQVVKEFGCGPPHSLVVCQS